MNAPLKVGIFAQLLPGSAGGIETNLLQLLRHLNAVDSTVEPLAIGPGAASEWLRTFVTGGSVLPWTVIRYHVEDSVHACSAESLPRRLAASLRRAQIRRSRSLASKGHYLASGRQLSTALRSEGVEVVHFPYQRYFETDLPFIFEPWDLQHLHYPENFSEQELRFREALYGEACQRARLVVVPTYWGKRDLMMHYGIEERKVMVVYRGPGELKFDGTLVEGHQHLNSRYIVYPAKFWPHKNHQRLFEALGYLRRKGCIVPLVCTGESSLKLPEAARRALSIHGLEHQIHFVGHTDRTALTSLLKKAEMLVFPSMFEGYGIPVLEAMALGVPVVCSRIGPLDEITGGSALQFDPNEALEIARAIEEVWNNADRRAELQQRGLLRAKAFSWSEAARDFILCYKSICNRALKNDERRRLSTLASCESSSLA